MTKFEQLPIEYRAGFIKAVHPQMIQAAGVFIKTISLVLEGEEMEDAVQRVAALMSVLGQAMGGEQIGSFEKFTSDLIAAGKDIADEMPMPV